MKKILCLLLISFVLTSFVKGQNFDSSIDCPPVHQSRVKCLGFENPNSINHYIPIMICKDSTTKVWYDMVSDSVVCEGDYLYAIKEISIAYNELLIKLTEMVKHVDKHGHIKDWDKIKKRLKMYW